MLIALGGSTNGVLHLLAITYCWVELSLDDFDVLGVEVFPVVADVRPSVSLMSELIAIWAFNR